MKKYFRKSLTLLLVLTLCLGAVGSLFSLADTEEEDLDILESLGLAGQYTADPLTTPTGTVEGTENLNLVAEDGALQLYADVVTGRVAVVVKDTGRVWSTNPEFDPEDTSLTPYTKSLLQNQMRLTYYDTMANQFTMNSYDDCVNRSQLYYNLTDNGIEFMYVFGEYIEDIVIPYWIEADRMETYLDRMSASDRRTVERQYYYLNLDEMTRESDRIENLETYPILEEHPIYALRENQEFIQWQLMDIFSALGYSRDDMNADNAANGYVRKLTEAYFTVPLTYALEDGELVVSVDAQKISYAHDEFPLTNIDLLPFFGATEPDESGYIFVPDGSGAIIDLESTKISRSQYMQKVYGVDTTFQQASMLEADADLTIKMPVYGLVSGSDAFFTVIEEGDALATIAADISGKTHPYDTVSPSFEFLPFGQVAIGNVTSEENRLYLYMDQAYEGKYTLRTSFLSGDKANYTGMADTYRNYLIEKGVLTEKTLDDTLPFYLGVIGSVNTEKKMLGVAYNSVQILSTYQQTAEIIKLLQEQGMDNIILHYTGWYNGGLGGTAATKVKAVGGLSKGMSLNAFTDFLNEAGIASYFGMDFQYVYRDTWFDGFSTKNFSPKYFDKSTISLHAFDLSLGTTADESAAYLVSPKAIGKLTASALKGLKKYGGVTGLGLGSIGNTLFSDCDSKHEYNRQTALDANVAAVGQLADSGYRLLGDNANAYMLGYTDNIITAPLFSNHYAILDAEVPFYELVLHGCVQYTGDPLNLAADYTETFLKSIETGAGLQVRWIYGDNSLLKETEYDYLYSVNYKVWQDKAAQLYDRANTALAGLQNQPITSHEILTDKVNAVTYGDGTVILVNYDTKAVTLGGVTVASKDFVKLTGADAAAFGTAWETERAERDAQRAEEKRLLAEAAAAATEGEQPTEPVEQQPTEPDEPTDTETSVEE